MPALVSPRLTLFPLTRDIIEARLREPEFELPLNGQAVRFLADWLGDPLPAFAFFLTALDERGELPGSFVAVDANSVAVGMLGTKGPPDAVGTVEIGYGFNPAAWGQGYATEAVEALVAHLRASPEVQRVTAQTATGNAASQRVLEKTGFLRTGTAFDEEDGDLIVWTHAGA